MAVLDELRGQAAQFVQFELVEKRKVVACNNCEDALVLAIPASADAQRRRLRKDVLEAVLLCTELNQRVAHNLVAGWQGTFLCVDDVHGFVKKAADMLVLHEQQHLLPVPRVLDDID